MSLDSSFNITLDSNDASFKILGDEKLRITSLGNLGIGTTAPGAKLHIDGISPTVTGLILRNTSGVNRALEFFNSTNQYRMGVHYDNENIRLYVVDGNRDPIVTFGQNGNVGIGTTAPSRQLTISNSSNTVEQLELRTTGGISDGQYTGIKFTQESDGGTSLGYIRCNFQSTGGTAMSFATRGGTTEEKMRISDDGNVGIGGKVGIGTTSPIGTLHVDDTDNGGNSSALVVQPHGIGIHSSYSTDRGYDLNVLGGIWCGGELRAGGNYTHHATAIGTSTLDNTQFTPYIHFRQTSYSVQGNSGQFNSKQMWWIRMENFNYPDLTFYVDALFDTNARYTKAAARIKPSTNNAYLNFTGQHRAFVENIHISQCQDFEGLIACADKNEFIDINKEVTRGKNAIQINQSIPYVSLCKKDKDKSCFGVLSGSEDPDSREYAQGAFISVADKTKGDSRFYVNSVGEGAIWVSNKNGNLESGDYITTSSVPGYGQKQDSEFLANYTVAKITMDCDFQPALQYKKKVLKRSVEISEVDASGNIYDVSGNIIIFTQPTGDEVTDDSQKRQTYSNPDYDFTLTNDYYISDVTENILNEHGEIQWEDTAEQEYAYDIRYVDATGNIITKEQHDTMVANSQEAYIAAFVGCTYHCG